MSTLEQEIETGKKINQPSDDPTGTQAVLTMNGLQSALTQYQTNLTTANGWLGATDSALQSAATTIQSAYTLAIQGANSSTTQQQRDTMASQIQQLESNLVNTANTQGPTGAYIFGGQKSGSAPLTVSGNTATYNGDNNPVIIDTGANQTMNVSTAGSPLFTNAYSQLETLRQNLLNGDVTALSSTSVANMQSSLDAINQERGNVGAKVQTVTSMTDDYTRRSNDLTTQISSVQDVDVASAITQYQSASTAYQAALELTSKGFSLSLVNYLQ
jgi:flagellar hook-associated protein 3 FlgL